MMKQKDAVYAALEAAQAEGHQGDEAIAFAVEKVKQGLMDGTIQHSKGALDEKSARSYAGSLISNWRKKDTRLNGGVQYVPETKRGPQVKDEQLRTLKANLDSLKAHGADEDLIARVEAAYEARKAQVQAEKAASKVQSLDETLASLQALGIDVAS
jgi:hypothetical protein